MVYGLDFGTNYYRRILHILNNYLILRIYCQRLLKLKKKIIYNRAYSMTVFSYTIVVKNPGFFCWFTTLNISEVRKKPTLFYLGS